MFLSESKLARVEGSTYIKCKRWCLLIIRVANGEQKQPPPPKKKKQNKKNKQKNKTKQKKTLKFDELAQIRMEK